MGQHSESLFGKQEHQQVDEPLELVQVPSLSVNSSDSIFTVSKQDINGVYI